MVKKFEFWQPHSRDIPLFWHPKFCQILSYLHNCSFLKISCAQRVWLKVLNFGCFVWGTSHFGTPKFGQILSFFCILLILKISCVQLKGLKSSNFGGPRLGRTPILEPPILLLNLFLISMHSKNLIHLALTV